MCRRLHKPTLFALAGLLLLAGWTGSPMAAQDVPEPQPEAQAEDAAEAPPSALDEAGEPPEMPAAPEGPEAPEAPEIPTPRAGSHGERVVIFESVTIEEDEVVREVVVVGGSLTILGRVEREAVVVGGPARVEGHVGRELTVVGGSLYFGPGASVGRDVTVVGGAIEGKEQAEIGGAVNNVRLGPFLSNIDWDDLGDFDRGIHRPVFGWLGYSFGLFWHLMLHALFVLLVCFAYLVAPDAVRRAEVKVRTEPGLSFLVALLAIPVGVVVVALFVLLTCGLGFLALPFLILAVAALWFVGYAAVTLVLGQFLENRLGWNLRSPYLAILLGFALVEIWGFLQALFNVPVLWWLSLILGIGACIVAVGAYLTSLGAVILSWAESRRRPAAPYTAAPATAGGPPPMEPPSTPEPEFQEGFEEPDEHGPGDPRS